MTIEEKYQELAQLKAELIAQREHAVENKSNVTRPTKHYYHMKKWTISFDIIITMALVYFCVVYFSTHNASDVLNFHDFFFNVLFPIFFCWNIYTGLDFALIHYAIEGDDFVSYNYRRKEIFRVSINDIRFIELNRVSKRNNRDARFVYNEYDEFYLDTSKNQEILADILRVNPDIEIRREL